MLLEEEEGERFRWREWGHAGGGFLLGKEGAGERHRHAPQREPRAPCTKGSYLEASGENPHRTFLSVPGMPPIMSLLISQCQGVIALCSWT